MTEIYLIFVFLLIFFQQCNTYQPQTKIWIPDTNYINPKNWLEHKLPCESSRIIFPEDLEADIFLPNDVKIRSIDLPNTGELILELNSKIEFTDENEIYENCNLKEMHFKKLNIEPWLKSSNWKIKNHKKQNLAVPHAERVPCIYDNIIFTKDSSFWIQYPEVPISVNNFEIEGVNITNSLLQMYLQSEEGAREFRNLDYQDRADIINIKKIQCNDKTGCLCHGNRMIPKAVCKNLQPLCNVIHCSKPVKPVGHCCEICGAYLILKFDKNNFDFNKFKKEIEEYLYIAGYTTLDIYVSKVIIKDDTRIQVVIVEKDNKYKGDSISAAEVIQDMLTANLKQYNLENSELNISGPEYWPGQQLKSTIAVILGTLLMVLITLIVIYYIYGADHEKKFTLPFSMPNFRNFRPFIFVRFENTGDADGGLEFRNRSVASSLFNLDRAFDNPLYGEPGPSTDENLINVDDSIKTKNQLEYQNPVYSELQKQEIDNEE